LRYTDRTWEIGKPPVGYSELQLTVAAVITAVGVYFVLRRVDVRLVLLVSAALLFAVAWRFPQFFILFAKEMVNDKTVVPICSAMGFAHVVKVTGCDRHLIHLLLAPLRYARPLLIPGGVVAAYLVNTAIVSQSSTAATVGPVLVPLVVAAGYSPVTAGALLLLGSSVGGELFNPGAVEIVTLATLTNVPQTAVVGLVRPANLLASITALVVFWRMTVLYERRRVEQGDSVADTVTARPYSVPGFEEEKPEDESEAFRVNPIKAAVPILPLVLLYVFSKIALPPELNLSIQIAAAMLVGTAAAGLVVPSKIGRLPAAFFNGAGFAYTHVISLIIAAFIFTEGLKATGLIDVLTIALASQPLLAVFAAVAVPLGLAAATGSGIAPGVAVMNVLVPIAGSIGVEPMRVGALAAVSAQLGRTMSPAAAVVMMSSAVSGVPAIELLKRVAPPLLAGAAVLLVAGMLDLV
jgi:DcuC family C4-dicarboxylate transporter